MTAPVTAVTPAAESTERRRTQSQLLLDLVTIAEQGPLDRRAELFHDGAGGLFVTLPVAEHLETYSLRSRDVKAWLRRRFYEAHEKAPTAEALTQALGVLEAKAQFDGPVHPVYVRVGEAAGALYLDLGSPDWRAVEITPEGWRVVARPPVKFRRSRTTAPLPTPVRGGSLDILWEFLPNVGDDDRPLILTFIAVCLRARGPYPILTIQGEQGSGKSVATRLIRATVDPSDPPTRSLPREERDLMIALATTRVIALDNLSRIPEWLSDALCRVATGAGYATRTLYTDEDETVFAGSRPVIVNGITELAEREDLRDRAIIVNLPALDRRLRPEDILLADFEAVRPQLLGALLDAVCVGVARLPDVTLPETPRMADFAQWSVACEPGLRLPAGAFLRAYLENRRQAVELNLATSPVAQGVIRLADVGPFVGTASQLMEQLTLQRPGGPLVPEADRSPHSREWPKDARALADRLRRLAPNLRRVGVAIEFARNGRRRLLAIRHLAGDADRGAGDAAREISVTRNGPPLLDNDAGDANDAVSHTLHPRDEEALPF